MEARDATIDNAIPEGPPRDARSLACLKAIDLPQDVWNEIFSHLHADELFRLRTVCKPLCAAVQQSRVWRRLVVRRWFSVDDMDTSDLLQTVDFFGYYRRRSRTDHEALARIDAAIAGNRAGTAAAGNSSLYSAHIYVSELWSALKYGPKIVPLLLLTRLSLQRNPQHRSHHLQKYYAVGSLLRSLRCRTGFELVHNTLVSKHGQERDDALEECFFRLAHFDPAFDLLLPFRRFVVETIALDVASHRTQDPVLFAAKSHTEVVLYIARQFFLLTSTIYKTHLRGVAGGTPASAVPPAVNETLPSTEDHFILRAYAGEVTGSTYVQFAIIQKIARSVGITSHVTKYFLVVEDPAAECGRSCLIINKKQVQVFRYAEVLRSLGRSIPRAAGASPSQYSVPHLQPLKWRQVLAFFFEFSFPSIAEIANNEPSQASKMLFPISRTEISPVHVAYVQRYYKLVMASLADRGLPWVKPPPTDHEMQQIRQKFVSDVQSLYFTDLPFLKLCWPASLLDNTFATTPTDTVNHSSTTYIERQKQRFDFFARFEADTIAAFATNFCRRYNIVPQLASPGAENTESDFAPLPVGEVVYHGRWDTHGIVIGWNQKLTSRPSLSRHSTLNRTGGSLALQRGAGSLALGPPHTLSQTLSRSLALDNTSSRPAGNQGSDEDSDEDDNAIFWRQMFYNVYTTTGDVDIYSEIGLLASIQQRPGEPEPGATGPDRDKGAVVEELTAHESVGMFFDRYDADTGRFVPTRLLASLYGG